MSYCIATNFVLLQFIVYAWAPSCFFIYWSGIQMVVLVDMIKHIDHLQFKLLKFGIQMFPVFEWGLYSDPLCSGLVFKQLGFPIPLISNTIQNLSNRMSLHPE